MSERQPQRDNKRTPITGRRNKLTVKGKDPNYEYRIVNTADGRPDDLAEAGYEIVKTDGKHTVGDKRVATPKGLGSDIEVSVGQGEKAVLMRQKKEWYDEDQKAKQKDIDAIEQTIRTPNIEGLFGEVKIG